MFNNNNKYHSRGVPEWMAYGGVPVGIPKGAVPQHATGGAVPQWAIGQDLTSLPQFAQNNTSIEQDGANLGFTGDIPNTIPGNGNILPQPSYDEQNLSPDLGLEVLQNQVKSFEKKIAYPYKDIGGLPTWGYGHMDNTQEGFMAQPWLNKITGLPATEQEKLSEYNKFLQLPYGQQYGANYYKNKTNLFLSDNDIDTLLIKDISDKNKVLQNFPYYNNFSQTIKNALIDSEFNTGNVVSGYPRLHQEANKLGDDTFDLNAFCENLHRADNNNPTMQERNNWTINQCLNGYIIPKK